MSHAHTGPRHLPQIAGMKAVSHPGHDRECWTISALASLKPGTVVNLTPRPQPVVITWMQPCDRHDPPRLAVTAATIDTGDLAWFELPETRSVLTRRDLEYVGGEA